MPAIKKNFFKKSSFLSIEKDLKTIIEKILDNQDLLKLLYYTDRNCMSKPDVTMEQALTMIGKQIRIVPYYEVLPDCPNYIIVTMDNFTPNDTNPKFRDCMINISILCHPDHWNLGDFKLRPFKILGELDKCLDNEHLSGIGTVQFAGTENIVFNNDIMGVVALYSAVHGSDDMIV